MRLHDILYGSDTHRVFHNWWEYARKEYLPFLLGEGVDRLTQYYDPQINHHQLTGIAGGLGVAFGVAPQKPEAGRLLFEAAADALGWTSLDPVRESSRELTTGEPSPRNTITGLVLAREYGHDAVYAKLKAHAEAYYEPTWDLPTGEPSPRNTITGLVLAREYGHDAVYAKLKAHAEAYYEPTWDLPTGEFTWGFGLNEPHPRGQLNATMMIAEAGGEGAMWRLFNQPNLRKFTDPTVHRVDFPAVCLSQAWYDVERRRLVVSTDAGIPSAAGQPTSFRVSNVDAQRCDVIIDGRVSRDWVALDDGLEINTTVGNHTVLVTIR